MLASRARGRRRAARRRRVDAHARAPRRRRGPRARARRGARARPTARGATLGVDEVEAYLGDVGTAGRFDLTNAIDEGDVGVGARGAAPLAHRDEPRAAEADAPDAGDGDRWCSTTSGCCGSTIPSITTKEQAADALRDEERRRQRGSRSRRRGGSAPTGCARRSQLLAQAELDLRGAERARRAHRDRRARRAAGRAQPAACSRAGARSAPGTRAGQRSGAQASDLVRRSSGATCGERPGSCG